MEKIEYPMPKISKMNFSKNILSKLRKFKLGQMRTGKSLLHTTEYPVQQLGKARATIEYI